MAKLVTKWRYLKPDAARHAQAYIRYIATREGVEKYVEENGARPAAQAQRVLVEKLLRDFPDARRSFEYEDYAAPADCPQRVGIHHADLGGTSGTV